MSGHDEPTARTAAETTDRIMEALPLQSRAHGGGPRVLVTSLDAPPRHGGVAVMAHHLADAFAGIADWSGLLGPAGTHPPAGRPCRYVAIEDFESVTPAASDAAREKERVADLLGTVVARYRVDAILLAHAYRYGEGALAAARRAGIAIGCLVHGLEVAHLLAPRPVDRNRARQERAARLRRLLESVDALFANSRATEAMLREAGVAAPALVCGVGLAQEDFEREVASSPVVDPAERRRRRKREGFGEGPLIVSVGRLVAHKRVDRLLALLARLPGAEAAIAGEGPERPVLEARAAALGLCERVRFLGNVSEEKKWALLRAGDFHVLFSERDRLHGAYEGFGIFLLEGCAAGSVTLSSGVDGMADFVVTAGGGVVLDVDARPDEAAARVAALAANAEERSAVVVRGRAAVAERYLWPAVATRILHGLGGRQSGTVGPTAAGAAG